MQLSERLALAVLFPFLATYHSIVALLKLFTPNRFLKEKNIKANDIVLITGAGMGLGREMAKQFVARGCRKLVIWDVNESAMAESKEILVALGCKVWTFKVDVTNRDEVYSTAETIKATIGTVTYLVNNAGIVAGKPILELQVNHVRRVFEVNTLSHFWTVQAFLPGMLREKSGHIVTIASALGFMGCPFLMEYSTSKFSAFGFGSCLRYELDYMPNGENIKTTLVCPWAISTGMFSGVDPGFLSFMTPEFVANSVLDAVLANRDFLVIPFTFRLLYAVLPLMPNAVSDLLLKITSNPATGKDLVGRRTFD